MTIKPETESGAAEACMEARAELLRAREMEAARQDARWAARDVANLRLFCLRQELAPYVAAMPEAAGIIDLTLSHGYPPRLWIDPAAFVMMSEDGRVWRLMEDSREERRTLFESENLEETAKALRRFIALRVVRRERLLPASAGIAPDMGGSGPEAGEERAEGKEKGREAALLWLAWLAGALSGALGLMAWLVHAGRLS